MKPFRVHVSINYCQDVIIFADDESAAEEYAFDLVERRTINPYRTGEEKDVNLSILDADEDDLAAGWECYPH